MKLKYKTVKNTSGDLVMYSVNYLVSNSVLRLVSKSVYDPVWNLIDNLVNDSMFGFFSD